MRVSAAIGHSAPHAGQPPSLGFTRTVRRKSLTFRLRSRDQLDRRRTLYAFPPRLWKMPVLKGDMLAHSKLISEAVTLRFGLGVLCRDLVFRAPGHKIYYAGGHEEFCHVVLQRCERENPSVLGFSVLFAHRSLRRMFKVANLQIGLSYGRLLTAPAPGCSADAGSAQLRWMLWSVDCRLLMVVCGCHAGLLDSATIPLWFGSSVRTDRCVYHAGLRAIPLWFGA